VPKFSNGQAKLYAPPAWLAAVQPIVSGWPRAALSASVRGVAPEPAMHHGEPCLIANRVVAPDFGHVDLVLGGKPTCDVYRSGGDIKVKRRTRASKMRPLRHGFEVIDGLGGFDLNRSHQLMASVSRRQHEIGKNLHLADSHGDRLLFANVRDDVVTTLESNLQESNDAVVLQLLANRANEYRAHVTSTMEKFGSVGKKNREL
jgi:hypothetical protein